MNLAIQTLKVIKTVSNGSYSLFPCTSCEWILSIGIVEKFKVLLSFILMLPDQNIYVVCLFVYYPFFRVMCQFTALSRNRGFSKRSSLLPQILLAISGHGANWILNMLDYNRAHVEIPVTFTWTPHEFLIICRL